MIFNLDDQEKQKWLGPLAWAVALHVLILIAAVFTHIYGYFDFNQEPSLSFRLKEVDTTKYAAGSSKIPRVSPYLGNMKFASEKPGDMVDSLKSRPSFLPEGQTTQDQTPQEVIGEKKADLDPAVYKDFDTILMETDKREVSDTVRVAQRSTAGFYHEKAKKSAQVGPITGTGLLKNLEGPLSKLQLYSPQNVTMDADEGMPGFTPTGNSSGGSIFGSLGSAGGFGDSDTPGGVGEDRKGLAKYESLDEFLDIQVYTYQHPQDLQKYFMIKIFAKKGFKTFKVAPKEIIFTIDSSLSISPARLEEVKKGIRYCLSHLNREDVFNILAFKDKTIAFSPISVAATPASIKEAERFVSALTASEQTDVYAAFKRIVELPLARRPSNVILISDGRPTHGLVDSREVINSISQINKKVRPIFAFSGGARVNRYLLDFISYQNRGWSQFIKNTADIDKGLSQFYDKIKDPIFLNLRYRLNGLDEAKVFPRSLPDFYANAEFTLFGSYKTEDAFSMQLLGDVDGKTKELIFSRSLGEAKKGSEEIMRGYAFNRIYYLISRVTVEGRKPELLREIEDLSRRFGITTPYSPELEKLD